MEDTKDRIGLHAASAHMLPYDLSSAEIAAVLSVHRETIGRAKAYSSYAYRDQRAITAARDIMSLIDDIDAGTAYVPPEYGWQTRAGALRAAAIAALEWPDYAGYGVGYAMYAVGLSAAVLSA